MSSFQKRKFLTGLSRAGWGGLLSGLRTSICQPLKAQLFLWCNKPPRKYWDSLQYTVKNICLFRIKIQSNQKLKGLLLLWYLGWLNEMNRSHELIDTLLFWVPQSSANSFSYRSESFSQPLKLEIGAGLYCGGVQAESGEQSSYHHQQSSGMWVTR